jgi:predicted AAA+ superfamily ATPase
MKRKIYKELLAWKNNGMEKPLMVIGSRQVGKTYIIKEFCENEFDNYIEVNLQKNPNVIKIFDESISVEEKFKKMLLEIDKKYNIEKDIIFFDEIQESESLIASLKYFCESEKPYKIIAAGSLLGVKLRRFHASFPVGKVEMINMKPMDFEEFLDALGKDQWIEEIKRCYEKNTPISIHERLLDTYRVYLYVGGMPESVKNYINVDEDIFKYNQKIKKNIVDSYIDDMSKYVKNSFESAKIEQIYKSIPSQLGNASNKFQYAKINKNARNRDYELPLDWLIASSMINKCTNLSTPQIPPKAFEDDNTFKLFINDVGLLITLVELKFNDVLLDKEYMFKGEIAENYIAQQLCANDITLHYFRNDKSGIDNIDIDFILYNDDGIIPIEVKAGNNTNSTSLNKFIKKYKPKYSIRISSKNFGFENNIKSIPLYAVFCIK